MTTDVRRLAERLAADVRAIVTDRLRAVVVFGVHADDGHARATPDQPVRTLVLVDDLGLADLEACARRVGQWARAALATPLVIASDEFARSLDAFPIEFGAIIARHAVVAGADPFARLSVGTDDLRRACEVQARGHLLHLREGYLEAGGNPSAIQELVVSSAAPLSALLINLALIDGTAAHTRGELSAYAERAIGRASALADVLALAEGDVPATDAARLYPSYLDAVQRLVVYVDRWGTRP
jgi:hypothetical protein